MKNIEKMQEMLQKEEALVAKFKASMAEHKKKADDIRHQIDLARQEELSSMVNDLELDEFEYVKFKKLLSKDRKEFLAWLNDMKSEENPTSDFDNEEDDLNEEAAIAQ